MLAIGYVELRSLLQPEGAEPSALVEPDIFDNVEVMYILRRFRHRRMPLGMVLSPCAYFETKLDEDKVFALLGVGVGQGRPSAIIPNYGQTATQTYIEVARELLESIENAPYLLPHAGI
jgi:hypothetical protein